VQHRQRLRGDQPALGTLYRHFPTKEALLAAVVRQRLEGMADLARDAEQISDPGEAFESFLRAYRGGAEGDAAFQLALLGSDGLQGESVTEQKTEFRAIVTRIIGRAVAAGAVRADLTSADFPLIISGAMSVMYFSLRAAPTGAATSNSYSMASAPKSGGQSCGSYSECRYYGKLVTPEVVLTV
jgi:AcrR family transcriptional regulator